MISRWLLLCERPLDLEKVVLKEEIKRTSIVETGNSYAPSRALAQQGSTFHSLSASLEKEKKKALVTGRRKRRETTENEDIVTISASQPVRRFEPETIIVENSASYQSKTPFNLKK